jgi:hypothetical protein
MRRTIAAQSPGRARSPFVARYRAGGNKNKTGNEDHFFRRRRDAHCPDGFLRFFFGDGRLSLVERTRPSIPGPGNIPISRQGKQYSWARVYRESAHQGQITTRRLAGDRNSVGIDSEKLWAALTQPSVRILQIFDDRRQLCLRGQTVID